MPALKSKQWLDIPRALTLQSATAKHWFAGVPGEFSGLPHLSAKLSGSSVGFVSNSNYVDALYFVIFSPLLGVEELCLSILEEN